MAGAGGGFGCEHYRRSVKLIGKCCSKAYYCRFCHDQEEDHILNRNQIVVVQCASCGTRQRAAQKCISCKIVFGRYVCLRCNLFDHEDKRQFHCSECDICRVGGKENYFHCKKCNLCLNINIRDSHQCVENASRSDCPICLLYLHASVKPLRVLECGHLLHEECYNMLLQHEQRCCPICQASFSKHLDYAGKPY